MALDQVDSRRTLRVSRRGAHPRPTPNTGQAQVPQQASHPLAAEAKAQVPQLDLNPRHFAGPIRARMDRGDLFTHERVLLRPLRGLPSSSGVVVALRYLQHSAQQIHSVHVLARSHEDEDFGGTASLSERTRPRLFQDFLLFLELLDLPTQPPKLLVPNQRFGPSRRYWIQSLPRTHSLGRNQSRWAIPGWLGMRSGERHSAKRLTLQALRRRQGRHSLSFVEAFQVELRRPLDLL